LGHAGVETGQKGNDCDFLFVRMVSVISDVGPVGHWLCLDVWETMTEV
jgi:hypothetical protein